MSSNTPVKRKYSLDFDEWMRLAKNNPDEFEAKRLKQIEIFFNNVPKEKQQRLKGLQWQIDQTRKLSRNPLASCIAISNMMWDSMNRLNEHHYELINLATRQTPRRSKNTTTSATILQMPQRRH